MKLKPSIFAFAATAALVATSSALTIDIVGSTAGRTAVFNRVTALIGTTSSAGSGSSLAKSNQAIMHGTYAGSPIIVRFNFTGSAAGVDNVANQQDVSFFLETIGTSGNTLNVSFAAPNIETSKPEIGYSDVFQSTTAFKTPALTAEDEVAIIPFKMFKSAGDSTALNNVTSQTLRYLYGSSGSAPLSLFTGLNADEGSTVYATGRDASSGTRITTFAEINVSQTAVSQYQPTASATDGTGSVTVASLGSTSTSGFSSGSFVINVLNSTFSGGTIVGYVGASDWPTVSPNNAIELKFNGVTYSPEALTEGSYTFWGYLHQFNKGLTGTTQTFYTALRNSITTTAVPSSGLELIGSMKVLREGDGYPINPILE